MKKLPLSGSATKPQESFDPARSGFCEIRGEKRPRGDRKPTDLRAAEGLLPPNEGPQPRALREARSVPTRRTPRAVAAGPTPGPGSAPRRCITGAQVERSPLGAASRVHTPIPEVRIYCCLCLMQAIRRQHREEKPRGAATRHFLVLRSTEGSAAGKRRAKKRRAGAQPAPVRHNAWMRRSPALRGCNTSWDGWKASFNTRRSFFLSHPAHNHNPRGWVGAAWGRGTAHHCLSPPYRRRRRSAVPPPTVPAEGAPPPGPGRAAAPRSSGNRHRAGPTSAGRAPRPGAAPLTFHLTFILRYNLFVLFESARG